jgi:hypothetical protein
MTRLLPRFASLILLLTNPALSFGGAYSFTRIAETSGTYSNFGLPSINNQGVVAFEAFLTNGQRAIEESDGTTSSTIAATGAQFAGFPNSLSINDTGTVAFVASLTAGGGGLFIGNGGPLTAIATSGPFFVNIDAPPSINNANTVAFKASYAGSISTGLFTWNNGAVSLVVPSDDSPFLGVFNSTINNAGSLVTIAGLHSPEQEILTIENGVITPIESTGSMFASFGGDQLDFPSINDLGVVAFKAQTTTKGEGIYTLSGASLATIADTNGAFERFYYTPGINDNGLVVFEGVLKSGPTGLFTGPEPSTDEIIAIGDTINGSTITAINLSPQALNNAGQITFLVQFADGTNAVYRADPSSGGRPTIPEPGGFILLGIGLLATIAGYPQTCRYGFKRIAQSTRILVARTLLSRVGLSLNELHIR